MGHPTFNWDVPLYPLDLETTGLDGRTDELTDAQLGVDNQTIVWSRTDTLSTPVGVLDDLTAPDVSVKAAADERAMIVALFAWLQAQPAGLVVTWNGAGFDLPFLAHRIDKLQREAGLRLPATSFEYTLDDVETDNRRVNRKYGPHAGFDHGLRGRFGQHRHLDICFELEHVAADLDVKWSLKPVLAALGHDTDVGGRDVNQIDRANLTDEDDLDRIAYAANDIRLTRAGVAYVNPTAADVDQVQPATVAA